MLERLDDRQLLVELQSLGVRVIDETEGGIRAQTAFLLMQTLVEGPTTLHMAGTYHDRFVRVDGRLRLAERQVIHDTNILANDLVYPV